ncbi:Hypothetical protein A7982_01840 [Minicystis rosea]|nr:Hypothetical protein A7982_01840 [Minicystis rosea]
MSVPALEWVEGELGRDNRLSSNDCARRPPAVVDTHITGSSLEHRRLRR